MTHANYQLGTKNRSEGPLGYLLAEVLCSMILSDH